MRKLKPLFMLLGCLAVIAVLIRANGDFREAQCRGVELSFDTDESRFLEAHEVTDILAEVLGDNPEGADMASIDLPTVESAIAANPYVESVQAYFRPDSKLQLDLGLKRAVVRIINRNGVHYYLDRNAELLPVSGTFTPRVLVVNGYLDSVEDSAMHKRLADLAGFIEADRFWHSMIDQVYVTREGEFELIPKVGADVIRVGDLEDGMAGTFRKLKIFYLEGLKQVGWDVYRSIDLKFDGQVVCTKK